jgi:hypothetical protein
MFTRVQKMEVYWRKQEGIDVKVTLLEDKLNIF